MLSVAFDLVDKDGSGYVDADEMEGMIKVCALTFTMCGCTNPRQCKHSVFVFAQCQMTISQLIQPCRVCMERNTTRNYSYTRKRSEILAHQSGPPVRKSGSKLHSLGGYQIELTLAGSERIR